jgi:hypothetical protein
MFEVTGNDITILSDTDLRELVRKLATAELRGQGCPISSVIAGGNQDAPDGGIDVRIQCSIPIPKLDFIKRQPTGFQKGSLTCQQAPFAKKCVPIMSFAMPYRPVRMVLQIPVPRGYRFLQRPGPQHPVKEQLIGMKSGGVVLYSNAVQNNGIAMNPPENASKAFQSAGIERP